MAIRSQKQREEEAARSRRELRVTLDFDQRRVLRDGGAEDLKMSEEQLREAEREEVERERAREQAREGEMERARQRTKESARFGQAASEGARPAMVGLAAEPAVRVDLSKPRALGGGGLVNPTLAERPIFRKPGEKKGEPSASTDPPAFIAQVQLVKREMSQSKGAYSNCTCDAYCT